MATRAQPTATTIIPNAIPIIISFSTYNKNKFNTIKSQSKSYIKYQNMNRDPRVYIAPHIVKTRDLFLKEIETLNSIIEIRNGEIINELYSFKGFYPILKIKNNTIIGLTNLRIFKLEKNNVNTIWLKDIAEVDHEKKGPFRWDNIVFKLHGEEDTWNIISVYHSKACIHIRKYIYEHISGNFKKLVL